MSMKKTHQIGLSSLVGIAALITFLSTMTQYIPYVHADVYKEHLSEFKAVRGDVTLILILQTEAEIVRLQDKIEDGKGDQQDRLRLIEKARQLQKLNERPS